MKNGKTNISLLEKFLKFIYGEGFFTFIFTKILVRRRSFNSNLPLNLTSHSKNTIICSACHSLYSIEDQLLNCKNCGYSLFLLDEKETSKPRDLDLPSFYLNKLGDFAEKLIQAKVESVDFATDINDESISCGWCEKQYDSKPDSPNCKNCGGVLSQTRGDGPGLKPPETPRSLPKAFIKRLYGRNSAPAWIGFIFIIFAVALFYNNQSSAITVFLIGLTPSLYLWIAYKRHKGLKWGKAVLGKIESIQCSGSKKGLSKLTYQIYFRFEALGETVRSMKFTYNTDATNHFVGKPVWVVYLPDNPSYCDIWPPIA